MGMQCFSSSSPISIFFFFNTKIEHILLWRTNFLEHFLALNSKKQKKTKKGLWYVLPWQQLHRDSLWYIYHQTTHWLIRFSPVEGLQHCRHLDIFHHRQHEPTLESSSRDCPLVDLLDANGWWAKEGRILDPVKSSWQQIEKNKSKNKTNITRQSVWTSRVAICGWMSVTEPFHQKYTKPSVKNRR